MKFAIITHGYNKAWKERIHQLCHLLKPQAYQSDIFEIWLIDPYYLHQEQNINDFTTFALPVRDIRYLSVEDCGWYEQDINILYQCFKQYSMDVLVFAQDDISQQIAARLAVRLDGSYVLDIREFYFKNGDLFCEKEIYEGRRILEMLFCRKPYCICLPQQNLNKGSPYVNPSNNHHIIKLNTRQKETYQLDCYAYAKLKKNMNLKTAEKVLLIGQGVGSLVAVKQLEDWAQKMQMQIAVTRPVALNGWANMEKIVGASGQIISPDLCIAVGVSGAPALLYGIKKSRYIVAVNQDPNAPIMRMADVAFIDDWKVLIH